MKKNDTKKDVAVATHTDVSEVQQALLTVLRVGTLEGTVEEKLSAMEYELAFFIKCYQNMARGHHGLPDNEYIDLHKEKNLFEWAVKYLANKEYA